MSSMMGTLPTIFECPQCGETIDVSVETCRFFSMPVDRPLALHCAIILAKVNRACSDGTTLRICAVSLPVFYILRFVPFLSMLGLAGFIGLSFAIPVWAVVWWARFGEIDSKDPDYIRSRKAVRIAGIVVSMVLLFFVIAPVVFAFLLGVIRGAHPTS